MDIQKKPNPKVTIKSIAQHCGVSVCTVSTVLQNRYVKRRIPMVTVERIRAAALELGYFPDIGARRLRSGDGDKMPLILAIVTSYETSLNLINYFLYALRDAVATDTRINSRYEISISIEMFPAGKLSTMKSLVNGNSFNAAIIANTMAEDDAFLRENRLPFPSVLVDRHIDGYFSVNASDELGRQAARTLIDAGRKKLGILYASSLTQATLKRVSTFIEEAKGDVEKIPANRLAEAAGYNAMKKFLAEGGKIDGLYTISDSLAMGAYRAIWEAGLSIPKDIAVVGVGDYEYSEQLTPPLTTVGVRYSKLAAEASALLLSLLSAGAKTPHSALVSDSKVVRESV